MKLDVQTNLFTATEVDRVDDTISRYFGVVLKQQIGPHLEGAMIDMVLVDLGGMTIAFHADEDDINGTTFQLNLGLGEPVDLRIV